MLLVIDSGNTNTVFAVYDGEECRGVWRCGTQAPRTADEYAVWLLDLMRANDLEKEKIEAAVLSSVVPETDFNLRDLCGRYFDCDPLVVGDPECHLGIEILIDRPEQVGADRLVNAVAAQGRYTGPLIIIDFGTATTFDAINADGNYLGGVICPGINLALDALHMAAAKLPRVEIKPIESVVGKTTVSAMQSGMFWGYVSMIEGLVERIRREQGQGTIEVVATGGLADMFAKTTDAIQHTDPDMTIRGLMEVYRRNKN